MGASAKATLLGMTMICCGKSGIFGKSEASNASAIPANIRPQVVAVSTNQNDAICETAPTHPRSYPTLILQTCKWQSNCTDHGVILLGSNIDPNTLRITNQADGKIYHGSYDALSGKLNFPPTDCPPNGATLVIRSTKLPSQHVVSTETSSSSPASIEMALYANPCSRSLQTEDMCPPGVAYIELKSAEPSCKSLELELGDPCPATLEKCELTAAQACADQPQIQIKSASYYYCRKEPFADTECGHVSNDPKSRVLKMEMNEN